MKSKRRLVLICLIFLTLRMLTAGELEIRFLYKQAVELLKNHEYEGAKTKLLKIIKINGNIPEVHNNLGYVFERMLDWDAAEQAYEKALKLRDSYYACRNNLANVHLKKRVQLGRALEILGELVRKYPDNSDILDSYGWATFLFDEQNSDSAEEFLKKAVFYNIGNYWAQHHLGRFYMKKQDYELSEKFLSRAVEACPSEIRDLIFFRYYLYRCYRLQKKSEKAAELLEILQKDLESTVELPQFQQIAGYKEFYGLMKTDILCRYRMSLISGFTNIVRKNQDQKVILDSDINLNDIKDYSIFKGLEKETLLFSDLFLSCKYRIDSKGEVVCSEHGYCIKVADVSSLITEYYNRVEKYSRILELIKSTELGNENK